MSLTVLILCLTTANAWRQYAEPLQVATPNSDGIYVFELEIAQKMTMSVTTEFGQIDIADYRLNQQIAGGGEWRIRSSDQLEPCDANRALNVTLDNLASILQLHGQHQRVIAINGNSPGLPIVVPWGAEVVLRVRNRLMNDVTLHVHGMDKMNMWYTDGVAFMQQCPINVGTNYAYRFIADTPGTHWYHGHMGTDRGEGLLGAFIVTKPGEELRNVAGELLEAGREYAVVIQDWSVTSAPDSWYLHIWEMMKWCYGMDGTDKCWAPTRIHDGTDVGGAVPLAAILINDKGWYNQDDVIYRPTVLPLETFRIKQGEKIRFRIINGGVSQGVMFTIENHRLTVVAADGAMIQPIEVDCVIAFPGERYDVIVEGLQDPIKRDYFMIIETLENYTWAWQAMEPTFGLAKLEYEGITNPLDRNRTADLFHSHCTNESRCVVLNCPFLSFPAKMPMDCVGPQELVNAEMIDDRELLSDSGFASGFQEHFINMHYDSHVNGWMFQYPRAIPYFNHENENAIADWCDPERCPPENSTRFNYNCNCFYHLNLTLGNVVQLTIYNMGEGGAVGTGYAHPIHIHGTHYYLMKVGYPTYDLSGMVEESNLDIPCSREQEETRGHCNDLRWSNASWSNGRVADMNTINPSSRDTVVLPVGGYITIRFRARNPGWFFAHCHLMLHHMSGTAFALRVGEHHQMPVPPGNFPNACGDYEPPSVNFVEPSPSSSSISRNIFCILPLVIFCICFTKFNLIM